MFRYKKIINYLNEDNDLVIGSRMIKGARNEEDDKVFKFESGQIIYLIF